MKNINKLDKTHIVNDNNVFRLYETVHSNWSNRGLLENKGVRKHYESISYSVIVSPPSRKSGFTWK